VNGESFFEAYAELLLGPAGAGGPDVVAFAPELDHPLSDALRTARADGSCLVLGYGEHRSGAHVDRDFEDGATHVLGLISPSHPVRGGEFPMGSAWPWPFPQTTAVFPDHDWGSRLYPLSPSPLDDLCDGLTGVLRLDQVDATASWLDRHRQLERRANDLNSLSLVRLYLRGANTNLQVDLADDHVWCWPRQLDRSGQQFVANLPCEEIFTAPAPRGFSGSVRRVKDLRLTNGGALCTGAIFDFNPDGVTVEATEGLEDLRGYVEMEGNDLAGEIALVDDLSRVGSSGRWFGMTLLDENAACHLALGVPLPGSTFAHRSRSSGHQDFVIDEALDVEGVDRQGTRIEIMREGRWVRSTNPVESSATT